MAEKRIKRDTMAPYKRQGKAKELPGRGVLKGRRVGASPAKSKYEPKNYTKEPSRDVKPYESKNYTKEPSRDVPKTPAPKTPAPKTPSPKTPAPKTPSPKTAAAKAPAANPDAKDNGINAKQEGRASDYKPELKYGRLSDRKKQGSGDKQYETDIAAARASASEKNPGKTYKAGYNTEKERATKKPAEKKPVKYALAKKK